MTTLPIFLTALPLEIKDSIYQKLLCNPILASPSSVTRDSLFGEELEYDLHPQILRVCRQIYDEASRILYQCNTFYIACCHCREPDRGDDPHIEVSPLTRRINGRLDFRDGPTDTIYNNAMHVRKVKHWRVIISTLREPDRSARMEWSLVDFCFAISIDPPHSMTVVLIPRGLDITVDEYSEDVQMDGTDFHNDYQPFETVLKPLRTLRQLKELKFEYAEPDDLPDFVRYSGSTLRRAAYERPEHEPSKRLLKDLVILAIGNSPLELMREMFRVLVTYARAFERCSSFSMQMGLTREERIDAGIYMKDADYQEGMKYFSTNPFTFPYHHPVEKALEHAKWALVEDDMATFKACRRTVLIYLEKQYLRIEREGFQLNEFVKYEKVHHGLFSVRNTAMQWGKRYDKRKQVAWLLLHSYVASFNRDAPVEVRAEIRKHVCERLKHYAVPSVSLNRNRMLANLGVGITDDDSSQFRHYFRTLTNDCDDQYLKIFMARKELFKYDLTDEERIPCGITTEYFRSPEKVKWDAKEPTLEMAPAREPYYDSDDQYTEAEVSPGSSLWDERPDGFERDSADMVMGDGVDRMNTDYEYPLSDEDVFDYDGELIMD
ncbi:hypothetical protein CJF32_00005246 [Rutstroemia sp. NJR-2017a WRK4]|nr:hypothetical protein CJF32_00005246 [Rutstroemia sp. NJR-2017a WRK4]